MTEENTVYYYQRDGKEFITVSLYVALARRDANTEIYMDSGKGKVLLNII